MNGCWPVTPEREAEAGAETRGVLDLSAGEGRVTECRCIEATAGYQTERWCRHTALTGRQGRQSAVDKEWRQRIT